MALRIELLARKHDRRPFDCGEPSLNEWLQRLALQQQEKNFAWTRVIVEADEAARILGYYELLLVDAIERTRRSIAEIGGAGLYADALNEHVAAFYLRYGF